MTEVMNGNVVRYAINLRSKAVLITAAVTLLVGATCGLIYGRRTAPGFDQNKSTGLMTEIIVSKDHGLLFKSEDGTPLLKIRQDVWGNHVALLSSDGTPLVELNNLQGTGGITVGSKAGGYAYVHAHEESATITLIGKYGKEAVEITSATPDGSGNLSINEGKKGYHAVEIGAGLNKMKSKGTITILSDNGAQWQAP